MTLKISTDNIQTATLASLASVSIPKITSITYPGDDTAATTAGGQTITLTGSGFIAGASVIVNGSYAGVVTVVSNTSITFTTPANSGGTYPLYVVNTDGGTAISIPGISYSGTPSWSNTAGSLATVYETAALSTQLTATGNQGDGAITYSVYSGTLPPGSSLNTSTGLLSGTTQATASSTTYTFTIRASDEQNQDTDRAFSITINPDAVTWSSPADGTVTSLFQNQAMANVTLSATSAAGQSIAYTANALPTGVTISGSNVTGTPTVVGNTISVITATAANTNRTATRTFTWVVSVSGDSYFKNTTLLLNGETTVTPFISDASANSLALTINGDTKPVLFNPYRGDGYYSAYFDGTGDYLRVPYNAGFAMGSSNFTIEYWVYPTVLTGDITVLGAHTNDTNGGFAVGFNGTQPRTWINIGGGNANWYQVGGPTVLLNTWNHIALVRNGSSFYMYTNGVQGTVYTNGGAISDASNSDVTIGARYNGTGNFYTGYVTDARIVKGTAVYTSAFTPPTSPLTAIANTSLLTCQSNRFIDNSTNNFTITKVGDTAVSSAIPFTANSSYSTYGSGYFDGTGDYLTVPDNTALESFTDFTIEFWVYFNSVAGSQVIVDKGWNGANAFSPYLIFLSGGSLAAFASAGGGSWDVLSGSSFGTPSVNTWYHIALTRSGSSIRLFRDGVVITTVTNSSTLMNSTSALGIGGSPSAGANPFNGYISNLRIVKGTAVYTSNFTPSTTPLTAIANTSLLTLQYNGDVTNKGIIDNSNFNNIITRAGNASQGSFSPYSVTGWSNYFDGTGDYLTVPSNAVFAFGTGAYTIEAWVYLTDYSGTSNYRTIVEVGTSAGPKITVMDDGSLRIWNAASQFVTTSVGIITLQTWHHVAWVRESTSLAKLYVNGTSVLIVTTGAVVTTDVTGTPGAKIGYFTGYGHEMKGYISNLRIVKGTAVYTSAFTPPNSPLTAIANTSLLTCQSNRFIDNSPNSFTLTRNGDTSVQAFGPFGSVPEAVPISYSNYFDGTGDYLTVPDNAALQMGSGDFTIEFWINYSSIAGYQTLYSKGYTAAGDILVQTGNGNGVLIVYLSGSAVITESTGAIIGTWYHYALVRSGTAVTLYRDGISRGTATSSVNFNTTNQLGIGAAGKAPGGGAIGDFAMNGYISNLRIIKGTAVYTSTFTPSTTPLTAIANTSLLTCQSTTIKDNSTNAFTITASGDTKPRPFNPFGYTAQSATSYTPTTHGGSIYFDGTGDYLTVPNSKVWDQTIPYTVEMWIYPTSANANQYLYSQLSNPYNGIVWTGSGFNVDKSYVGAFITGSGSYSIYQWIHVAMTYDGTTTRLFANGTLIGSAAGTGGASGAALYIANYQNAGTYTYYGYMSDLRVTPGKALYTSNFYPDSAPATTTTTIGASTYSSALLLNFNNGGIIDQHGTNVLETVGNAQLSTAVKKYGSSSLYFDGTGDSLKTSPGVINSLGSGDFTIEGWVYPSSLSSMRILSQGTYTTGEFLFILNSNGSADFCEATTSRVTFSAGSFVVGEWKHFAIVRSGSGSNNLKGYINGTLAGTGTSSSYNYSATTAIFVGSNPTTASQDFQGYIDDLRITKGYARYTANFTPPTALTTR